MPIIILPKFAKADINAISSVIAYESIDGYNPGSGDLRSIIYAASAVAGNARLDDTLFIKANILSSGNITTTFTENLRSTINTTSLVGGFFTYGEGRGNIPKLESYASFYDGITGYSNLPSLYSEADLGWYIPPDAVGGYAILLGLSSAGLIDQPDIGEAYLGPMIGQGWLYTEHKDEVFIPPIFLQAGISAYGNIDTNEQIDGRYNNELAVNISALSGVYSSINVDGTSYLGAELVGRGAVTGSAVHTHKISATIACKATFNPSNDLGQLDPWTANGGGFGYLPRFGSYGYDGERLIAYVRTNVFAWNPTQGYGIYTANLDGTVLFSDQYISLLTAAIFTDTLPTSAATITSTFNPYAISVETILDQLSVTSLLEANNFFYKQFISNLATTTPFTGLHDQLAAFAGSLSVTDTFTAIRQIIADFLSTLTLDDTISVLASYQAAFTTLVYGLDTYLPSVGTTIAPLAGSSATWVIDVDTQASVQYDGFGFNSYAKRGDEYLAAAEDGLYLLGGDTDAGENISALLDLAVSRFATPQRKYFPSVYLGVTSTGKLLLKAEVDGQTWIYEANNTATNTSNQRIDLGRGLVGSHWRFTILNQDGLDFELESVEFLPLISSRRIY